MTDTVTNYTLQVDFDIDQTSERLDWKYVPNVEAIPKNQGLSTGVDPFKIGDTIGLVVAGNSIKGTLKALTVVETTYITRPILHSKKAQSGEPGEYAAPSPFFLDAEGQRYPACVSYGEGPATIGDSSKMTWTSPERYTCNSQGRWDTSFVMTVLIEESTPTGSTKHYRVFTFDPETDVGPGGGP